MGVNSYRRILHWRRISGTRGDEGGEEFGDWVCVFVGGD